MSNWSGFVLTKKGQQLLAKVEAGETLLNITKMKTGDGVLPVGQALEDLTDLVSPKQLVGITTKEALTGETGEYTGETRVSGTLANNELEAGYSFKEWGIFADDPDSEKDILYAISIDSAPDYIPPKGSVGISQKLSARIVISNAASITIVVDMNAMATMKDLTTSINNHNTAADAHADIRQAIENIDVSQDIQKHNTDPDAHANMKAGVPVGTIIATGNTNIPDGYLLCDGGAISRTTYSALFAAVGETYGAGDGSTTFNLPLLTDGRFLEGSSTAGECVDAGLPNITGNTARQVTAPHGSYQAGTYNGALYDYNEFGKVDHVVTTGDYGHCFAIGFDASKSNNIYGKSSTVQPLALQVLYCIKYI